MELLLGVWAVAATVTVVVLRQRLGTATLRGDIAMRNLRDLRGELEPLRQYQQIPDAEAEATRIRSDAATILDLAQTESKGLLSEARKDAKAARERQESDLRSAGDQVEQILAEARAKALDIAQDAWKAKEMTEHYRNAARAMKNVVDGYGDEYIVPNHSVIDDLADDFLHKEAGEQLKQARADTRKLVQSDAAAQCDYVEERRATSPCLLQLSSSNRAPR
jgi:hypothetical protein